MVELIIAIITIIVIILIVAMAGFMYFLFDECNYDYVIHRLSKKPNPEELFYEILENWEVEDTIYLYVRYDDCSRPFKFHTIDENKNIVFSRLHSSEKQILHIEEFRKMYDKNGYLEERIKENRIKESMNSGFFENFKKAKEI